MPPKCNCSLFIKINTSLGLKGTLQVLNNLDGDAELESANFFPTFVESIVKGNRINH